MPGFGKSGTSRINDFKWSIYARLSLDSKCRICPCRLQVYLFDLIDYRPLWTRRQIVFERFDAISRSFRKRFDTSVRTVTHVTDDLMARGCALRKETVTNPLHVASDQKLSRYCQTFAPICT
jgi:hypothetical protein